MGHFYDEIPDDPKLLEWIRAQVIFHVATAPLDGGGHVNVSPKGQETFKLMNRKACWYLDLTGSGNETISHIYEPGNGRMTILFQAFEGAPRLLRLFGKGRVIEHGTPEFDELMDADRNRADDTCGFPTPRMLPGARAIIWLDIHRVGTSCGYSVPFMKFEGHRNTLNDWARKREEQDVAPQPGAEDQTLPPRKGLQYYWVSTNSWSIDGLPGMKRAMPLATPTIINTTREGAGLPGLATTTAVSTKRSFWYSLPAWVLGIFIGLMLPKLFRRIMQLLYAQ